MEDAVRKIRRWIPSKYDDSESCNNLLCLYNIFLGIDFTPLLKQFGNRLQKIKYNFTESVIASGAMCFLGSLLISFCQVGYVKNIEELFTYAACYILTDHYIDDNTVSKGDKSKTILQIDNFINRVKPGVDNELNIESPIIKLVADKYIHMINKIPKSADYLKEIFKVEVSTMYLQNRSDLPREKYIEISEWKGGVFCKAIQAILELDITTAEYDLGATIQLIDDILDIEDDASLEINSIATYDYKTYGNLDKLLIYIVNKVDALDKKYTLFKPVLYLGLSWAVHNNKNMYTLETVKLMDHFIYYQENTTKPNMILWLKNIITSI
jgi:hypothetical protein